MVRHLRRGLALSSLCSAIVFGSVPSVTVWEAPKPAPIPTFWERLFVRFLPTFVGPVAEPVAEPEIIAIGCHVQPLSVVEDAEAVAFEQNVSTGAVVNVEGLTAETARSLDRFDRMVRLYGGRVNLTSAYRPASYQAHLQSVWDKWMVELRYDRTPECRDLRASVEQEFRSHELLERQRPVALSDHTRGMAFDATVLLPRLKRRVTMDSLALRAGLLRPDRWRDPVHFRLAY